MNESDQTIVALIVEGNPRGLNRLLARYGHVLAEYVRAIVFDDDERFALVYEDVLVDILKSIRSLATSKGNVRRSLLESAARTVRKRYANLLRSPTEPRGPVPSIGDMGDRLELDAPGLGDVLAKLSPSERELLVLRYRFGFRYAEISDIIREARVQLEDRILNARYRFRTLVAQQPSLQTDVVNHG